MTPNSFEDAWTDDAKTDPRVPEDLNPNFAMADLNAAAARLRSYWQQQPDGNQKQVWNQVDSTLSGRPASTGKTTGENSVGWNSVGWNSVGWNSVGWNKVRRLASIAAIAVMTVGVAAAGFPLLSNSSDPAAEPRFAAAFHEISADTGASLADGAITPQEIATLDAQAQVLLEQVANDPTALNRLSATERAGLLESLDAVEAQIVQSSSFGAGGINGIATPDTSAGSGNAGGPATGEAAEEVTPLARVSVSLAALRAVLETPDEGFQSVPVGTAETAASETFAPDVAPVVPAPAVPEPTTPTTTVDPASVAPENTVQPVTPPVPALDDLLHDARPVPGNGKGQANGIVEGNGAGNGGASNAGGNGNGNAPERSNVGGNGNAPEHANTGGNGPEDEDAGPSEADETEPNADEDQDVEQSEGDEESHGNEVGDDGSSNGNSGQGSSDDEDWDDENSDDEDSDDEDSDDEDSDDEESGNGNAGNGNSGDGNSGNGDSGNGDSGNGSSGNGNAGSANAGSANGPS